MRALKNVINMNIFGTIEKLDISQRVVRLLSIFFRKINCKCYLLPLILIVSLEAFSEERKYLNHYRELYTGVTPIHEMLEYLGEPDEITGSKDNIHYLYHNLQVTALKSTGKIDSITIYDRSYIDPNGMSIGSNVLDLIKAIREKTGIEAGDDVSGYWDTNKGIIYWFDEFGLVDKIILKSSWPVFGGGGN